MNRLKYVALAGFLSLNFSCFHRCICLENEIKDKGVPIVQDSLPGKMWNQNNYSDEDEMYYHLSDFLDSSFIDYNYSDTGRINSDSANYGTIDREFLEDYPELYDEEEGW